MKRYAIALGFPALFGVPNDALAFCNNIEFANIDVHCDGIGHQAITGYIDFLSPAVYADIEDELVEQDRDDAKDNPAIHFDACRFQEGSEYIKQQYDLVIEALNPAAPRVFSAADRFGELLHPVQDFYAHTNYYDLHGFADADPPATTVDLLVDRSVGPFRSFDFLTVLHDDVIIGEVPPGGLPAGWSASLGATSAVPLLRSPDGTNFRALVTGWRPNGACPDVRDGFVVDEFSSISNTGNPVPRTTRLVHGGGGAPCRGGFPTWVCLNQDKDSRPYWSEAFSLAGWQTQHEWCRLLHLAKASPFGLDAASILMALWSRPELPPHPDATPCGDGPSGEAVRGPVEVRVSVDALAGRGGDGVSHVFAMYTADFKSSAYATSHDVEVDDWVSIGTSDLPEPLTLCVRRDATVAATLWGWDDGRGPIPQSDNYLDPLEAVRRGVTLTLPGPSFAPGIYTRETEDMRVTFTVTVNSTCDVELRFLPAVLSVILD